MMRINLKSIQYFEGLNEDNEYCNSSIFIIEKIEAEKAVHQLIRDLDQQGCDNPVFSPDLYASK